MGKWVGAWGRCEVAVLVLPLALPRLAVTIGLLVLLPPSLTTSMTVTCPPAMVFVKFTVTEPLHETLLGVVT